MKEKFKIMGIILLVIALVLICFGVIKSSINKGDKGSKVALDDDFVVKNIYKEYSIDEQLALLLASDYMREQADIKNLNYVDYRDDTLLFDFNLDKNEFGQNTLVMQTKDFVEFTYSTTTYESKEPTSRSGVYYDLLYKTRNMVYNLAKNNGYTVSETLSKKKVLSVFDILHNSSIGSYITAVENKGYVLKNYGCALKGDLYYVLKDKKNNYLRISCSFEDLSHWRIEGTGSKSFSKEYIYSEKKKLFEIDIKVDLDEKSVSSISEAVK